MSVNLGYLVSRYPAISHTFILREVLELRRLGFRIEVASINNPDRPSSHLTGEEQAEARTTFYVKGAGAARAVSALASSCIRNPLRFAKGIWFSLKSGGADLRKAGMSLFYFVEAVMVGEWMRAHSLRHLHVHFATPAATVGLVLTQIYPFTLSLTVHGPDEFYDVPGYLLAEKVSGAYLLCTIGSFARSQLMKISSPSEWNKIHVTPLGVDPDLFSPRPFRQGMDVFEVLCVGRLVPAKGQHILLAAVQMLRSQGRQIRLRLVGDGPDRQSLEATARLRGLQSDVIFEGAVNQDRIRDLYETTEVFVLASFAEGIPVVLMEAMAMEIPCIATWITGIPELIRHSVDGILVPPADVQALADALTRLMDDENLRQNLGKAGRLRVIEKYNLRKNVSQLAQVFDTHLEHAA